MKRLNVLWFYFRGYDILNFNKSETEFIKKYCEKNNIKYPDMPQVNK